MSVDRAVQEAVIAWANAADVRAAAKVLAASRASLAPSLIDVLISEIAEITVESIMNLLLREPAKRGEKTTRVGELDLKDDHVQSLHAWVSDHERTSKALGLKHEGWLRALDAAMQRMLAVSATNDAKGDRLERVKAVNAFLANAPRQKKPRA